MYFLAYFIFGTGCGQTCQLTCGMERLRLTREYGQIWCCDLHTLIIWQNGVIMM